MWARSVSTILGALDPRRKEGTLADGLDVGFQYNLDVVHGRSQLVRRVGVAQLGCAGKSAPLGPINKDENFGICQRRQFQRSFDEDSGKRIFHALKLINDS